jgi:putative redox protein
MTVSGTNGHSVVVGRSPLPEFTYEGVKPSDLLLMAVVSCSAYDVVNILQKQRENLTSMKVICKGQQKEEPPYNFTAIYIRYILGGDLSPTKVGKAIRLSEEKYCSVMNSLRRNIQITSEYELLDVEAY